MGDRHHGHPLGGTLIIGAIFSVALAFYLATPPAVLQPASVPSPMSAHAAPVPSHPPAIVPPVARTRAVSRRAEPLTVVREQMAEEAATPASVAEPDAAPEPTLEAFSWSTVPTAYPPTISAHGLAPMTPANHGAVTQAFATAGSALRSALTRVF